MKPQTVGMKPRVVVEELPIKTLLGLVRSRPDPDISDKNFLEQLAMRRCFLVPPWILRAKNDGGLERVTLLTYDRHMNLNKNQTLGTVIKTLDDRQNLPQERARVQARQAS